MNLLRQKIRKQMQPLFRALKVKKYCRMSLGGIDRKLEPYLGFKNGVFLEAGANDGLKQSNTYYLEAILGWKGILVEPVPELYERCRKYRKNSKVFNSALVSRKFESDHVVLQYADLMTSVTRSSGNTAFDQEHITRGLRAQNIDATREIRAKADTLSGIIDRAGYQRIDFLSLDLEGYEAPALEGLDFDRHGPTFLLIEVRNSKQITELLGDRYIEVETITDNGGYKDILFKRRD